jgi:glycosyltransferase involved in cell wall biosynthesis
MKSISVVIPCFNEEKNLKRNVLSEVSDFLEKSNFDWEVVIANDQSTDNSLKIIEKFVSTHPKFRVVDLPHGGKPSAVWGGIQAAKKDLVLFTDMDQSTPIKEIDKLVPFFDQGYDVVIGSRGSAREGYGLMRRLGGPIFLSFRKLMLLSNINDTQCGFKMFRNAVAKDLFPNLQFFKDKSEKKGWRVSAFDVELLFMAQKWGYKIKEVLVNWRNEDISDTKGDSRYQKESVQMIKEIIRVKSNDLKGLYEKR